MSHSRYYFNYRGGKCIDPTNASFLLPRRFSVSGQPILTESLCSHDVWSGLPFRGKKKKSIRRQDPLVRREPLGLSVGYSPCPNNVGARAIGVQKKANFQGTTWISGTDGPHCVLGSHRCCPTLACRRGLAMKAVLSWCFAPCCLSR